MGIPNKFWRLTTKNNDYTLCDTYPSLLAVPANISDELLMKATKFRSRGRIPALSFLHKNGSSITRCSQPLVGIKKEKNEFDIELINGILNTNPTSKILRVLDARPLVNAIANTAIGKGYGI